MSPTRLLVSLALVALTSAPALACPADPDPDFGTGGVARTSLEGLAADGNDAVLAGDGSIVVAGSIGDGVFGAKRPAVFRFTADGDLDESFGTGGFSEVVGYEGFLTG